jgi:hypothetical protein
MMESNEARAQKSEERNSTSEVSHGTRVELHPVVLVGLASASSGSACVAARAETEFSRQGA